MEETLPLKRTPACRVLCSLRNSSSHHGTPWNTTGRSDHPHIDTHTHTHMGGQMTCGWLDQVLRTGIIIVIFVPVHLTIYQMQAQRQEQQWPPRLPASPGCLATLLPRVVDLNEKKGAGLFAITVLTRAASYLPMEVISRSRVIACEPLSPSSASGRFGLGERSSDVSHHTCPILVPWYVCLYVIYPGTVPFCRGSPRAVVIFSTLRTDHG